MERMLGFNILDRLYHIGKMMTMIGAQETCRSAVRDGYKILLMDLEAVSEKAFSGSLGGCARNASDLMYEVCLVNEHIRLTVCGEELFDWPSGGWLKAPVHLVGKEAIITHVTESRDTLLASIERFTDTQMLEPFQDEGRTTTRFERYQFISHHMWYHSGQLNFMQTLLGDDQWHWSN
jgi:hypothetical protein